MSFVPIPSIEKNSQQGDRSEEVGADDTILDAPPTESPRLGQRKQGRTPSKHESEPGLDQEANLEDQDVGPP